MVCTVGVSSDCVIEGGYMQQQRKRRDFLDSNSKSIVNGNIAHKGILLTESQFMEKTTAQTPFSNVRVRKSNLVSTDMVNKCSVVGQHS